MTILRTTASVTTPLLNKGSAVGRDGVADMQGSNNRVTRKSSPAVPITAVSKSNIEELIARHYVGLRLLITRRTGDPNVAADLLNDAVCTTWEKWQAGLIERPEQIAGYIFQVAMNLLRNHRRGVAFRLQRRINTGELEALPAESNLTNRDAENQMAARVRRLIEGLGTERDRVILTRFYLNEESKEMICRDLGLAPQQFDKVLHRARGRLRELLESEGIRRSDVFSVLVLM